MVETTQLTFGIQKQTPNDAPVFFLFPTFLVEFEIQNGWSPKPSARTLAASPLQDKVLMEDISVLATVHITTLQAEFERYSSMF